MNEFLTYCMVLTRYETNKIDRNFNLLLDLLYISNTKKKQKKEIFN